MSSSPLAGVRVVSLAPNLPGPLALARLVSMGASAVKVDPPAGDFIEQVAPSWYAELVEGVDVRGIDLKSEDGLAEFTGLLAEADLLITSMRPSASERLGIPQYALDHGVALVEIVGHDGDNADQAGHDLTYQAVQGTLEPPTMPRVLVADIIGGERATSAALLALREKDAGRVVRYRVSLEDAAEAAGACVRHGLTAPGGILSGQHPEYRIYASKDGHVAVAALEPHFHARLREHIGSTIVEIEQVIATRTAAEWEAFAAEVDIPLAAVRTGEAGGA